MRNLRILSGLFSAARPTWILCLLLVASPLRTAWGSEPSPPPNIVLILADDLGIGDPTCYNRESKISTPHIDRIAHEGMRFNDVHSASSVCSPTRYAILTGRYAWRTRMKSGVLQGYSRALIDQSRPTLPSILKQAGYATAGFGKWHLGFQQFNAGQSEREQPVDYANPLRPGPVTLGFDEFFGIPASLDMPPYLFVDNDHPVEMPTAKIGGSGDSKYARGPFWPAARLLPRFIMPTFCRGSPNGPSRSSTIRPNQAAANPFSCISRDGAAHALFARPAFRRQKRGRGLRRFREHGRFLRRRGSRRLGPRWARRQNTPHHDER